MGPKSSRLHHVCQINNVNVINGLGFPLGVYGIYFTFISTCVIKIIHNVINY